MLAVCYRFQANVFLGAFAAGITVASISSETAEAFEHFGELVAELLKLLALFLFGAAMVPRFFIALSPWDYVFVALATFAVRPLAIRLVMAGTELSRREVWVVGWFGPKEFASVVYGIMILQAGFGHLAHLVGLAVTASIVIYSSTDIFVGKWLSRKKRAHIRPQVLPTVRSWAAISRRQSCLQIHCGGKLALSIRHLIPQVGSEEE